MPGMATPEQIGRLKMVGSEEAERDFLTLMIRYHRAGVGMAQAILARTSRPEVRRLAVSIDTAQASEIRAMEGMLARRGSTPVGGQ